MFNISADFWIFVGGIAVGIAGAFGAGFFKKAGEASFAWLSNKLFPKPLEQHQPQVVVHVTANGSAKVSEEQQSAALEPVALRRPSGLTFEDIRKAYEGVPPLQRQRIADSFVGIRVDWDTFLKAATQEDGDMVRLLLTTEVDVPTNSIVCRVKLSDYRELGVLPKGARIRVAGEIAEADSWDVRLDNVQLEILG